MIQFNQIKKTYPRQVGSKAHVALNDISFFLGQGKTLGLVGANGAGKSTSICLIMDFIRPDQGIIQVFGKHPQDPEVRLKIGYLPEKTAFPRNLSVLDMLQFVGRTCRMSKSDIAASGEKWLKRLNLWDFRKSLLRTYSKGMQQRASFAIAMIHDPDLLILDEPMSGLDPLGRADIIRLIRELKEKEKTILFCSHLLEDVDRLADDVLILHKGRHLFHGLPSTLCKELGCETFEDAFLNLIEKKESHGFSD
ncbi:MAG: ABC transporter ATP-binding protein [Desulfobacterium sp.]|nr:ABC transporter ATP-binding protein [Desulfobacterium sp.]